MTSPITPLGDRVVASREEAPEKTASGLYLPTESKEKPFIAKVLAVGPEAKSVKVGDKIIYKEYSTTELTINDIEYLIVREEDVLGTVAKTK